MSLIVTRGFGPYTRSVVHFDPSKVKVRVKDGPISVSIRAKSPVSSVLTVRQLLTTMPIRRIGISVKINPRTMKTKLKSC